MEKQNKVLLGIIALLVASVFTMAVGFAVTSYNESLEINGTATFNAAKWEIKFVESSYAETDGSVKATTHSVSGTTFRFDVTLAKPGEFYEASVDAINNGTFDANLISVTISNPLSDAQKKFAKFVFTYDNVEYSTTTDSLTIPLAKDGGTKTAKVRVEYVQPDDEADLPSQDLENIEFAVTLNYEQA